MKRQKLNSQQKTLLTLGILVILIFFLENANLLNLLKDPVQKLLEPAQIGLYKSKQDIGNLFSTITEIGSLRDKKSGLERENALLLAENARLRKLEDENKILREQLGAKIASKNLILASVIGSDPLFSSSKLILDKGRDDGVKINSLVILKDILIGQIVGVGSSTATVQLLNDPETKITAVTEAGVKGILQGEFGTKISLVKVVQNEEIRTGQIVFTLGESGFPKGLVLGKIIKVDKNPAELFQKAGIEPLIPFSSLDLVFIVK